jgi:hypothetical protein
MSAVVFAFLLTADPGPHARAGGTLYEGTATLVDRPPDGPLVCGALNGGEPPVCGNGLRVKGLRWTDVSDHQHADDARWVVAHIVARYDGDFLWLTATPVADDTAVLHDAVRFGTPCDPPEEGWTVSDETLTDEAALGNLLRYADRQRDLTRRWVDRAAFPGLGVQNLSFTGDLDRHRAELRQLWGGPLCVTQGNRTIDSLEHVARRMRGAAPTAPTPVVSVAVDEERGAIRLVGLLDLAELDGWIHDHAAGAPVVVESVLRPSAADEEH